MQHTHATYFENARRFLNFKLSMSPAREGKRERQRERERGRRKGEG